MTIFVTFDPAFGCKWLKGRAVPDGSANALNEWYEIEADG